MCARLERENLTGTRLEQAWEAVKSCMDDPEESAFCRAAAMQGMDPYTLEQEEEARLLRAAATIPESLHDDFFHVAAWDELDDQAACLAQDLRWIQDQTGRLSRLAQLRTDIAPPNMRLMPWGQGYALARELDRTLGRNGQRVSSIEELGGWLGLPRQGLEQAVRTQTTSTGIEALVGENEQGSPGFVLKPLNRPENTMLSFCRALCEYFLSPGMPRLVLDANTERQKRNRAFAAELLAPADKIQAMLSGTETSGEEIDEIAYTLGVSSYIVAHQIENHGLARVEMYRQ